MDEKKSEAGSTEPETKPGRKRGQAAQAPSAVKSTDQVRAEVTARAETLPAPEAPKVEEPKGSGIKDAYGVEVPTEAQFVAAGGKAEDYDTYVYGRCTIATPGEPKPAPAAAIGKAKAEQILIERYKARTGQSVEPPLRDEEMKEDWQEVQKGVKQAADPDLAGLYIVTHGTLFFHAQKIVPKGRKVFLGAEDAKAFLEQEMVRPLRTAA